MGTFIDDAVKKRRSNNHEYEDVIVQGQIIDAKMIIQDAIDKNRKDVIWYYVYESYDSYTTTVSNIYPGERSDSIDFTSYLASVSTVGGYNFNGSVCNYLYDKVFEHRAGGPSIPASFDYAYVEKRVEQELRNLGCKQVKLYIGPKTGTITSRVPVGKKNFLTGKYKYQDVTRKVTCIKWIISVSW